MHIKLFLPYTIRKEKEKKHGLALIIVNTNFQQLPLRDCADEDLSNLEMVWKKLGYRVRKVEDKTADDIKKIFKEIKEGGDSEDAIQQGDDSFVCCISSHGTWDPALGTDVVYGVDGVQIEEDRMIIKKGVMGTEAVGKDEVHKVNGKQMEVECHVITKGAVDIKELAYSELSSLNCPKLKEKPKLFFIQACRGKFHPGIAADDETKDKKYMSTAPKRLARETDFLFAYATVRKRKAYRNEGDPTRPIGSFFITYLCQYLQKYASRLPLVPILEVVSQQHALEDPFEVGTVITRQSPNFSSSLRGPVFFSDEARKQYEKGMLSAL